MIPCEFFLYEFICYTQYTCHFISTMILCHTLYLAKHRNVCDTCRVCRRHVAKWRPPARNCISFLVIYVLDVVCVKERQAQQQTNKKIRNEWIGAMLYECVISCYAQLYYKPWIQYVVHMLFIHIFISNGWMLRSVSPNFFFLQLNQLLHGEVLRVFRAVFVTCDLRLATFDIKFYICLYIAIDERAGSYIVVDTRL